MRKTNDTKDELAPEVIDTLVDVLRDHLEKSQDPTDRVEENIFVTKPPARG
jgi:Mg2+ and Co2+ transporter CorA